MPKTAEPKVYPKAPCTLDEETRDLLTRAARAAGITILEWVSSQANVRMPDGKVYGWNPLAEWGKGSALQLVVQFRLNITPLDGGGWHVDRWDGQHLASCANGGAWALQLAIVEAAAKLTDGVVGGGTAPPARRKRLCRDCADFAQDGICPNDGKPCATPGVSTSIPSASDGAREE